MKYSGFRRDVKRHVLTFSTLGQRQVTTFCTCAMMSGKKSHVSGCRRQAGDICCLRCLLPIGMERRRTSSIIRLIQQTEYCRTIEEVNLRRYKSAWIGEKHIFGNFCYYLTFIHCTNSDFLIG